MPLGFHPEGADGSSSCVGLRGLVGFQMGSLWAFGAMRFSSDEGIDSPEISGDSQLFIVARIRYLVRGLREVVKSLGQRCSAPSFHLDLTGEEVQSKIREGGSPFRVYTCGLAQQLLPLYISGLGPICDLGCGSGDHARLFERSGARDLYVGIDVVFTPSWSSKQGIRRQLRQRFAQMSAVELGFATGSLGFTFSSSLLEHLPNIQHAIREIARSMRNGAYGLHVVPGVWSLFLYMFHGYRRFSPQTLRELFRQAGLEVAEVWSLGGIPSFVLHWMWITCPFLLTAKFLPSAQYRIRTGFGLKLYSRLLFFALWLDRWFPLLPVGYAAVVRKPGATALNGLDDREVASAGYLA